MLTQTGFDHLLDYLKSEGFKGNEKDLSKTLNQCKDLTELDMLKIYIKAQKVTIQSNEHKKRIDDVFNFIKKCFFKYEEKALHCESMSDPSLHFYSNKKIDGKERWCISFYFYDDTYRIMNGFKGESLVRILYGYDDCRKEKYIVFKEKEKYVEPD